MSLDYSTNPKNFWLCTRPRYLMKLIGEAKGEQYDAVAYDSGYDYDSKDVEAVRFIASVIFSKYMWIRQANYLRPQDLKRELMPTNGIVVKMNNDTENESIIDRQEDRYKRIRETDGFYLPEYPKYADWVNRIILGPEARDNDEPYCRWKMTPKEINKTEWKEWREDNYNIIHYGPWLVAGILGWLIVIAKMAN